MNIPVKETRYSAQREAIYNFLKGRDDHPTADIIYEKLRKSMPNISKGTVYRNLNMLVETGKIMRLCIKDSPDRFDGRLSVHHHFVCEKCGKVSDVFLAQSVGLDEIIEQNVDASIDSYNIILYGTCSECKMQKKLI